MTSLPVFNQKLKSLMSFFIKHRVWPSPLLDIFCRMAKAWSPHAHILVWLGDKIRPDEIDSIILAEIPHSWTVDPKLHTIVTNHMIHEPCAVFSYHSPYTVDVKCTKRCPRDLIAETITGNDEYLNRYDTIIIGDQLRAIGDFWILKYTTNDCRNLQWDIDRDRRYVFIDGK